MRDCPNVEVRERLPELVNDRLSPEARADVQRHVDGCDDCRAELEILRRVIAVTRPPAVDTGRIVATLPTYRRRAGWRAVLGSPAWQLAAAVVLLVGVATTYVSGRRREGQDIASGTRTPSPGESVAAVPSTPSGAGTTSAAASRPRATPRMETELALGDGFQDLSDSELRTLLADLDGLEAVPSADPEVVVPSPGSEER